MSFETGRIAERPLVYLAGAISAASDGGAGWRANITPYLLSLGYKVFNPYIEQPKLTGIPTGSLGKLRESGNLESYFSGCQKVVKADLGVLKSTALVVAKIDSATGKGAGTWGELTVSRFLGIPVFAWIDSDEGINSVPSWAMGCIDKYSLYENDFYRLIPSAETFSKRYISEFEMFSDNIQLGED